VEAPPDVAMCRVASFDTRGRSSRIVTIDLEQGS